jgi:hypothetical protein
MNFRVFHYIFAACIAALYQPSLQAADDTFEDGPVDFGPGWVDKSEPWRELNLALPPWPGDPDRLVELNVSTSGMPYRVYIDPESLTVGSDRVVRYTAVIVSSSGSSNVSYEGLHCGKRNYRRFAYGIDGAWQPVRDSDWQRITGHGVNRYRRLLYEDYLCDTSRGHQDAAELVRRLTRAATDPVIVED